MAKPMSLSQILWDFPACLLYFTLPVRCHANIATDHVEFAISVGRCELNQNESHKVQQEPQTDDSGINEMVG